MSQTLYRKYRPQTWSDIAGQAHVKDTLSFEVASGQLAHAYLLAGPRGVGKTTTARIFAKAVNCTERKEDSGEPCNECESCKAVTEGGSLDIIEIDAASHTGVDSVRENIVENARFSPSRLKNKVFIIDEVHMLSTSAFNALLKTLEEPPPNVMFMLATTELHKIPATVISRCQRFDFRKISVVDVIERLGMIAENEKIKIDDAVLAEIARLSEGCLRDAESLFGKLLAVADGKKKITQKEAALVLPRSDWETAAKLVDALVVGDISAGLAAIGESLDSGSDIEQFMDEITEMLRKAMLVKLAGNTEGFKSELDESRLERVAAWSKSADLALLVRALDIMLAKRRELKGSHPIQLPLELAAVLICEQATLNNAATAGSDSIKKQPVAAELDSAQSAARNEPVAAELDSARPTEKKPKSEPVSTQPSAPTDTSKFSDTDTATAPSSPDNAPASSSAASVAPNVDAPASADVTPVTASETSTENSATDSDVRHDNSVIASEASQSRGDEEAKLTSTVEDVKKNWLAFKEKVSETSHSLMLLLGATQPIAVSGRCVQLGSSYSFYKDKLNEDKTKRILEDTLSAILGEKVLIEGVTLEKNSEMVHNNVAESQGAAPAPTAAPEQQPEARSTEGAAGIAAAFGGEIVG